MDRLVEVYAASDITLAYLIKAHLEDAGVPVQIANENVSAAYCIDGMVPRVLVPADRAEEAREIIAEIQSSSRTDEDDDFDDMAGFDDPEI
ncbi:DUF2007 domain-containing protein [Anaerobaca lacustris]|uniref:DUF2007 domain-containing protein n=1 Tax=Anaerobaca lacustris TaxID=3044600 RepID=A0AAW6TY10_9BACT|nr:DUF2007 domain-containing protein [Sedimentisphaerales bacterium M17dextr]